MRMALSRSPIQAPEDFMFYVPSRPLPPSTMILHALAARPTMASLMLVMLVMPVMLAMLATPVMARQPVAVAEATDEAPGGMPKVPPLPEGTPEQLMQFITKLKQANVKPTSRKEMMAYMSDMAAVSLQAAEKILSQVKSTDALHDPAAKMKLESLMMLGRMGDEKAAAEMTAFAASLVNSPSPKLAREAQRLVLVGEAQKVLSTGDAEAGGELVKKTAALLAADPDDMQTAGLAMQLAGAFEQMPGGEEVAAAAYGSFGPIFAKSSNEQVRKMAESLAGTLRRLTLPGHPMEIRGTLLNGKPFDQKSLAGKVVLVDFWATWCGPCVAEIPNVLEQYQKYHDKGFEVVGISLDQDRDALEKFVTEQKLPWPILFEQSEGDGWAHPLATFYGISGIPTVILIGRDGNVITLNARGEKLGEQLDSIFKKAG
ncbi:MAG: TlpA family protein disulfide reductase [Planctomycetes bacterium]|nr:TlpA family protein disulfide reductase [Planctomycetota bacterium]